MCRLFGFRSVIRSQVHRSLISAENALSVQSQRHPDGWGVAYYVGGAPHLIKSASTAIEDTIFHRVSGVVSSETVVAHIRRATQGLLSPLNSHPFQYGSWIFAHNGNIACFEEHRPTLVGHIEPNFRRYILGDTDSEILFYLLLTHMADRGSVHREGFSLDDLAGAVRDMLADVAGVVGPFSTDPEGEADTGTFLTFIVTNNRVMLAHQGGQRLCYSTHKTRCPERDTCPSFADECEKGTRSGFVNHLVLSSEPLQGDNVWTEMTPGQIVGVDGRMRLRHFSSASLAIAAI